jgi:ADP-ribose pyrophosphatase
LRLGLPVMNDSTNNLTNDSSTDSHLREHAVSSKVLVEGGFLEVRIDTVRLPDDSTATREYVLHPGAVAVLPLFDDGRVLLERQFRYPVGQVMLEIPAGKIDPGESTLVCAARELREETGHTATEWAFACKLHNAAAYSNEFIEVWFARGLSAGQQQLDAGEFIEICAMPESDFAARAGRGEITDVKTLVALLWLQNWRAGLWTLQWQAGPSLPPPIMRL